MVKKTTSLSYTLVSFLEIKVVVLEDQDLEYALDYLTRLKLAPNQLSPLKSVLLSIVRENSSKEVQEAIKKLLPPLESED